MFLAICFHAGILQFFESLTEHSIPIPHINVTQKQQNDFEQFDSFLIHHESLGFFPSDRVRSQL